MASKKQPVKKSAQNKRASQHAVAGSNPARKPVPKKKSASRAASQSDPFLLRMDIAIPARADSVSPLVDVVLTLVEQTFPGRELEIETALREALANAIIHGCHGDPRKFVQCSVTIERGKSVHIMVRDPGPGFNPRRVPDPTRPKHLHDSHGRGIYLINHLMDEVRFRRGGSEIHMRKF